MLLPHYWCEAHYNESHPIHCAGSVHLPGLNKSGWWDNIAMNITRLKSKL